VRRDRPDVSAMDRSESRRARACGERQPEISVNDDRVLRLPTMRRTPIGHARTAPSMG